MAKISKSTDTANWRKGKDLKVGDEIATAWAAVAPYAVTETSRIESIELVNAANVGQRGGRQYRAHLANGKAKTATGAEFVQGRF